MRACLGPRTSRGTTVRLNRLLVDGVDGPEGEEARVCGGAKDGHFILLSMDSLGGCESYAHRASFGLQILDGQGHRRWWWKGGLRGT